ncbi:MAG: family 1 encapsulin nanocompartment shell protein [Candidatus Obscuribacterales bacterium]
MQAPLDSTNAERDANRMGDAEDALIFNGHKELQLHGLLNHHGALTVNRSDWRIEGTPAKYIHAAISKLLRADHHFPYALVASVDMY